jgi:hypothetical protein
MSVTTSCTGTCATTSCTSFLRACRDDRAGPAARCSAVAARATPVALTGSLRGSGHNTDTLCVHDVLALRGMSDVVALEN